MTDREIKPKVVDSSTDLVIAVYPGYFSKKIQNFGFSCGWYNEATNYCTEWGNYKNREEANEILRAAYPNAKILNLENMPITRNHSSDIRPIKLLNSKKDK
jgi:hypothetical protein